MKGNFPDQRKTKNRLDFAIRKDEGHSLEADPKLIPYHEKSGIPFERNYHRFDEDINKEYR